MKKQTITVNVKAVYQGMVKHGYNTKTGENWSDSLLETLEELYGLETAVADEILKS